MKCVIKQQVLFSFAAATLLFVALPKNATAGMEPFVGEMSYVGFNFAPRNWAKCDGQLLSISQNNTLFALLGNAYGGDGRTTFGLPDMRGRVPIHQGRGPGLADYVIGGKGGHEIVTLDANHMPSHTHLATATSTSTSAVTPGATATSTLKAVNTDANIKAAEANSLANAKALNVAYSTSAPNVDMHSGSIVTTLDSVGVTTTTATNVTVENAGGSTPFSIIQPYAVVNCIIALEGIFPSRQ